MANIRHIRKDYTLKVLIEKEISPNPLLQFSEWLNEAILAEVLEPTAMALSTVSSEGRPSSRIVLLKHATIEGFDFFTNQQSKKGKHLQNNSFASLLFFWPELERQVRIEGKVQMLSNEESDNYFDIRPEMSKIGAWASPQSSIIPNRKTLEDWFKEFEEIYHNKPIKRPPHWGGYRLVPELIEFWQGRVNRLHDRIEYTLHNGAWQLHRLAP